MRIKLEFRIETYSYVRGEWVQLATGYDNKQKALDRIIEEPPGEYRIQETWIRSEGHP